MADPKTIVIQLKHIQPGQQWSTRRGNRLRFMVWAGADQPLDGTLQLAVELHPQSASGGTEPLAAATVELPTGESATVDFSADQMALDLDGLKAMTVKVVVVRVDEGGDPDTVLTGSLIVEGNPSSAQIPPGGPVYLYATASMLAEERAERQALGTDVTGLSEAQTSQAGRITAAEAALTTKAEATTVAALEAALPGKASRDLTDALSSSVLTRHIADAVITYAKLDPTVKASFGMGLDPSKSLGAWNAATNTPTAPTASAAGNGAWYWVSVAGTNAGNAAGTYGVGTHVVSNGTAWQAFVAPPTNIPDGSLTAAKTEGAVVMTTIEALVEGVSKLISWGVYAKDVGGNKLLQFGIGPDRRFISEHIKEIEGNISAAQGGVAVLAPLADYLEDEGIPRGKVEGTRVEDKWLDVEGTPRKMLYGWTSADRTTAHLAAIEVDGVVKIVAPSLIVPGASSALYPQDGGGIGIIATDSTGEGAAFVDDGADWSDLKQMKGTIWIGRSNRLGGRLMFRIDTATGRVLPMTQEILFGFGGAGQSLRVGTNAAPALSTTSVHPGWNLMFSVGASAGTQGIVLNGATLTAFVNHVESVLESPASGGMNRFQSQNLAIFGTRIRVHYANHADGGTTYAQIKKGTQPYTNGITEVTRAQIVAAAQGWDYIYLATLMDHGEANENAGTSAATYDANMREFAADIAADVMAATGQDFAPLLILSQVSSHTFYNHAIPTIALGQLSAALADPLIVLSCPKYFLTYVDGLHLVNTSSQILGEYAAKAKEHSLMGKGKWFPLHPTGAVQASGTVTVTFHVPVGDLAFDTTLVSNPGNYGFELAGATITSVSIVGNTVVIAKTGTATAVRYAYTGTAGNSAGRTTGARGNLRDSDPAVSQSSVPLYNWCVHFSLNL